MRPRPIFLALLLFSQLTLVLTLGAIDHPALDLLAAPLSFLLPLLLLFRAPVGTPPLRFPVRRASLPALALLPTFILVTAGLSIGWGSLCDLVGIPTSPVAPREPLLMALVFDALLPALLEELFCRGALFSVLRPLGRRAAVLGSALLFAIMHASLAQIPYALVAGILLALLYELTGSLVFPILFHFANNATSLLLWFGASPLLVFPTLGAAALLGLVLLFAVLRRSPPPLPPREDTPGDFLGELFSLPVLSYLAVMLTFTLL